jgi:uncharacterized protein (TIGR00369 family)
MTQPPSSHDTPGTLDRWIAEESAVQERRARGGASAAVASREQIVALTGLQQMEAMLRGELPHAAMGQTLDFLLVQVGDGTAVFQGRPGPRLLNPMGMVHGGWFATMLDSALGCAVHTTLPPGKAFTTTDLHVHMVRGIAPTVARVRSEGRVLHRGRQLVTAEARLLGPDGTLYAHGTTSCMVLDIRNR